MTPIVVCESVLGLLSLHVLPLGAGLLYTLQLPALCERVECELLCVHMFALGWICTRPGYWHVRIHSVRGWVWVRAPVCTMIPNEPYVCPLKNINKVDLLMIRSVHDLKPEVRWKEPRRNQLDMNTTAGMPVKNAAKV